MSDKMEKIWICPKCGFKKVVDRGSVFRNYSKGLTCPKCKTEMNLKEGEIMNENRCPFCFTTIPRDLSKLPKISNPHPYCYTAYKLPCNHYITAECKVGELNNYCHRSLAKLEKNDGSRKAVTIRRMDDGKFDKLWCPDKKGGGWVYIAVCVHRQRTRQEGCINCWQGKLLLNDEKPVENKILIRRRKR